MSLYAQTGQQFTAILEGATQGIASQITVGITDATGTTYLYGPSGTGIVEGPAGVYSVQLTAPAMPGGYTVAWYNPSGNPCRRSVSVGVSRRTDERCASAGSVLSGTILNGGSYRARWTDRARTTPHCYAATPPRGDGSRGERAKSSSTRRRAAFRWSRSRVGSASGAPRCIDIVRGRSSRPFRVSAATSLLPIFGRDSAKRGVLWAS